MSKVRRAFLKFLFFGLAGFGALLATSPAPAEYPLVLQVHPYLPAAEILARFSPLAEYLGRRVGRPVVVRISIDYQQHIELIGEDKVDFAFMGPASYVNLVNRYGEKPLLLRLELDGKPTFKGAIIVARDSGFRSLSALKGKSFAFGDPDSTMSHLVPRYMLSEAGVDLKDLARHAFLRNHHNVALGVLVGKFDAGAVKSEIFFKYEKRGLRVLAWTPALSEHLFVTSSRLPKQTVTALREALAALADSKEGRDILKGINVKATGLVPVADSDYDNLRTILGKLEKLGAPP